MRLQDVEMPHVKYVHVILRNIGKSMVDGYGVPWDIREKRNETDLG